jgi:cytochrome c-type biogenesis protein CcmH
MRPVALFLLLCLAALAVPPSAGGQVRSEAETEMMVRTLAAELRCPVCQGVSIQESPTELALEMKGVIRGLLNEGRSPQEVKDYFVDRYGEWVLLEPKREGFNLLVYLLPFVVLGAGLIVVARTVRKWSAPPPGGPLAGIGLEPQTSEDS